MSEDKTDVYSRGKYPDVIAVRVHSDMRETVKACAAEAGVSSQEFMRNAIAGAVAAQMPWDIARAAKADATARGLSVGEYFSQAIAERVAQTVIPPLVLTSEEEDTAASMAEIMTPHRDALMAAAREFAPVLVEQGKIARHHLNIVLDGLEHPEDGVPVNDAWRAFEQHAGAMKDIAMLTAVYASSVIEAPGMAAA